MKHSASCLSDIGVLSLDSESIQNASTPTAYTRDSSRTCQEEAAQNNDVIECRILETACNTEQIAVVEGMHTYVQKLTPSSDINMVVYTETIVPGALQTENGQKNAGCMHELNQMDSSGIQQ